MLSGAEKACTLLDSVVESLSPGAGTAGAGIETLAQLMGETASKISCGKEAAAEHARKLRDLHGMLQNRTQETLSSMFKVCTAVKNVDPAIQGCGDDRLSGTKSFGEKSQNFINFSGFSS